MKGPLRPAWKPFVVRPALGLVFGLAIASAQTPIYNFSTLAGLRGAPGTNDGVSGQARFNFPAGIALDAAGTLYVADFLNHAIRRMTRSGTNWLVSTIAGLPGTAGYADGTNSDARFSRPAGIAVDSAGDLFVSERYNHTIRKISPVGTNWVVTTVAGLATVMGSDDGTNTDARFYLPTGIAVDPSNNLFVADTENFTIREISPIGGNWVVRTIAGSLLNFGFLDGTNADALFDLPYDIAVAADGKLYVADWGNNAIRQLSRAGPDWVVETIAGTSGNAGADDGPGSTATFYSPTGVAVDSFGNVYVADQSNDTIRKLTPGRTEWMVTTLAGQALKRGSADGAGTNAFFTLPWGIASDPTGNLFVTDYVNCTIRLGTTPPALQIAFTGGQVTVSWPAWDTSYILETASGLGPGASWVSLTNGLVVRGQQMVFTTALPASAAFYRLQQISSATP